MSQISIKSPKHCANQGAGKNIEKKRFKKLLYCISCFITSILLLILIIWLILHPSKPQFSLQQADIYQLNISVPHLVNSYIQLTLQAKNPNQKVGIYYDQLQLYASYKGQQITIYTSVPPFYQKQQETNLLTAFLVGSALPVAPTFGYQVGRDQLAGKLMLNMKARGRLRWKVGTWVSGGYHINIDCVAVVPFGPTAPPLTSKKGTRCSATI